jgi:hypothetical protein
MTRLDGADLLANLWSGANWALLWMGEWDLAPGDGSVGVRQTGDGMGQLGIFRDDLCGRKAIGDPSP